MKNLAYIFYSHSSYSDLWKLFFGQEKRFVPGSLAKYAFVDQANNNVPDRYKVCLYDDVNHYRQRLLQCLESIAEPYLLFQHEDMVLYDYPQWERIESLLSLLSDDIDWIKLIRGGRQQGRDYDSKKFPGVKLLESNHQYIFAVQPTLFKKSSLIKLLEKSPGNTIWDFETKAQQVCRQLGIKACYVDDKGQKRGKYHWDSLIYPYIATAIVKGKWNREYRRLIESLSKEYGIDLSKRGWK